MDNQKEKEKKSILSFRSVFLLRPPVMYSDFTEILSDSAASPADDENTFRDIFFYIILAAFLYRCYYIPKRKLQLRKEKKNLQRSIAIICSRKRTKSVNLNTF